MRDDKYKIQEFIQVQYYSIKWQIRLGVLKTLLQYYERISCILHTVTIYTYIHM